MAAKKSKNRHQLMLAGSVLVLACTAVLLYITFFSAPEVDVSSGILQTQASTIPTKFNTSVLNDVRTQNLNQFGPEEVTVQDRGRKEDPFAPF